MVRQSRYHVNAKVEPRLVKRGERVKISGNVLTTKLVPGHTKHFSDGQLPIKIPDLHIPESIVPKQEMRVDVVRHGENLTPGCAAKSQDTKKFTTDEKGKFSFVLSTKRYVSGNYRLRFYCPDEDPAEISLREAFEVMRPSEFRKLIKDLNKAVGWILS